MSSREWDIDPIIKIADFGLAKQDNSNSLLRVSALFFGARSYNSIKTQRLSAGHRRTLRQNSPTAIRMATGMWLIVGVWG